jgi:hypothetical protein
MGLIASPSSSEFPQITLTTLFTPISTTKPATHRPDAGCPCVTIPLILIVLLLFSMVDVQYTGSTQHHAPSPFSAGCLQALAPNTPSRSARL